MDILFPLAFWWYVGFVSALGARWALEGSVTEDVGGRFEPITRGGVIACAFGGITGPVATLAFICFGLSWLWFIFKKRFVSKGWLKQPAFPRRPQ